jgi:2-oxoglutarate dehydrogenase E2 component (dihydrolipoamide succinyltransferase)
VIGLPEILVRCIALARDRHPALYAKGDRGGDGRPTDVGVTVDVGSGLFIPVVESADTRSLDEIAEMLMGFRKKAMQRRFATSDLAGAGDIVLSLSHEPDIVIAQTIVFPGHIGMVSLGGSFEELFMEQDTVRVRRYVNVGLTYDHRHVNGREAVEYLRALKSGVEAPERLDSPLAGPSA